MSNDFTPVNIVLFFAWLVQFIAWWKVKKGVSAVLEMYRLDGIVKSIALEMLSDNDLTNEFLRRLKDDPRNL